MTWRDYDSGRNFIESAFDAVMLAMSISTFMAKPNLINGIAVLLDGISLALPFVPGEAGLALRTMIKFTPDSIKYLKKIFGRGTAYRAVRSFISKYRCKLGTFANKKVGKKVFRQCFTAGTLISTADGLKAIEDVQVGDNVYAVDTETGEVGLKDVKQTFVRETDVLVHLTMEDESADEETITTTVEHPFWVDERERIASSKDGPLKMNLQFFGQGMNSYRALNNYKTGRYKISLDLERSGFGLVNIHLKVNNTKYYYDFEKGDFFANGQRVPSSLRGDTTIKGALDKAIKK